MDYKTVTEGTADAEGVAADMPLSFWGGVNVETGEIQDVHHKLCGETISGKILCIPSDRGSCSGSGVMLEMIRLGTHPAGLLCIEVEPVLSLGAVIGEKLYGRSIAIRTVSEQIFHTIPERCRITFAEDAILISEDNGQIYTCEVD